MNGTENRGGTTPEGWVRDRSGSGVMVPSNSGVGPGAGSGELTLFATTPKAMEPLLAAELRDLGARQVKETRAGCAFQGTLETAYRVCLWSRVASRVLLRVAVFPVATADDLYAGVRALPWDEHLRPEGTLAVDLTSGGGVVAHSVFGAQRVKDAVVDWFRSRYGVRPSVDRRSPDVRLNVHIASGEAVVSLDLSGESLHRRGYRGAAAKAEAPLKENLAAAVLLRAGWPSVAAGGGPLVDPMCGSGTILIEGALMAAGFAPGLLRGWFGFLGWRGHDPALWKRLVEEARSRGEAGLQRLPPLVGFDADPRAVGMALAAVERTGLRGRVRVEKRALREGASLEMPPGLVVVNPPYGRRLGAEEDLRLLYAELGVRLQSDYARWRAAVLTPNPDLAWATGLRAKRSYTFYNGAMKVKLFTFEPDHTWSPVAGPAGVDPGARMFANRLRKNLRTIGSWACREGIECYRLYDADLPEYAVAVDVYGSWVHVQEYEAPPTVHPGKAARRLRDALAVITEVLDVPCDRVHLKVRRRQKGRSQYEKLADTGVFHEVHEGGARLLVNFTDHLDTGLFLDHRPTRGLIRDLARGARFLNLFAYTGAATVAAAAGGARSTTSVDLSRTYLEWARRNLELNGFRVDGPDKVTRRRASTGHRLVQADVVRWVARETARYDLVLLDPPTFSSSKRMEGTLDIQRDHAALITAAARLLDSGGVLLFSTNLRRFKLDPVSLAGLHAEDITAATIPRDFRRNPRIHRCWKITR
ncbi:MAG: bifunctional 23S rRNA (guanine(2069)-N(7))-methyltransferase RlmK/23S rRNA (guanine(2445)-N(2))-methyltransferase RlmL [Thermoleophilia bacterium]